MTESNNVRFVENNGKWMWKRYDERGSVIFRSPEFNTERQAREDYEANGVEPSGLAGSQTPPESTNSAPENGVGSQSDALTPPDVDQEL